MKHRLHLTVPALALVVLLLMPLTSQAHQCGQGSCRPLPPTDVSVVVPMGQFPLDAVIEPPSPELRTALPGLESMLAQLYQADQASDEERLATFSGHRHIDLAAGTARVILVMDVDPEAHQAGPAWCETIDLGNDQTATVEHAPPIAIRADLQAAIEAAGATYETAYRSWVQVLTPFDSLVALGEIDGVRYVRLPFPAQQHDLPLLQVSPQGNGPLVGTQTTEGVALTGSDIWHDAGYDGTGINLAVYDFGFTGWTTRISEGNLPSDVVCHSSASGYDCTMDPSGYEHGTACAEIAYDMAPGSTVHLYSFDTDVEFANWVGDYINNVSGKKVASMSIGWVNAGPYDGTGSINDIINDAEAANIFWANSAGNSQKEHYSWTSAQYGTGDSVAFGDGNVQGFGPEPGYIYQIPRGTVISAFLEWNDWNTDRTGNQSHIDYDIYLLHDTGSAWEVVDSSVEDQCGTAIEPLEAIWYTVPSQYGNDGFGLLIQRYTGGGSCPNGFGHWMQLHSFLSAGDQPLFWYINECNSLTIPADADGAVAVGAADWSEDETPPLYGLEYFSSLGPRNADGGGNPGTTVSKPDVVAPDGVSTATYGASAFFGTSASAPHVAGLAATVWEGYPSYTLAQLRAYIETEALYKGDGGACGGSLLGGDRGVQGVIQSGTQNNRYGWGRIDAGETPLPVELAAFSASGHGSDVRVFWETASEIDLVGFNLYRSTAAGGPYVQVNGKLIPARNPGAPYGAVYTWWDRGLRLGRTYYYQLEAVSSGGSEMYGPISVTLRPRVEPQGH